MEFQGGVAYKVLLIKKACMSQINEILKHLCSRNNFIFVEHKNICFNDLWVDGIHLLNSGKGMLGSNFISEVNK